MGYSCSNAPETKRFCVRVTAWEIRYWAEFTVLGGTRDRVKAADFTDAHISRTKGAAAF